MDDRDKWLEAKVTNIIGTFVPDPDKLPLSEYRKIRFETSGKLNNHTYADGREFYLSHIEKFNLFREDPKRHTCFSFMGPLDYISGGSVMWYQGVFADFVAEFGYQYLLDYTYTEEGCASHYGKEVFTPSFTYPKALMRLT